jgi:protocatechuate 3,4-dioxygenase, beta subunit
VTVSERGLVVSQSGELALPGYVRPQPGNQPPLDCPAYKSTALRHPQQPLVLLPHRLTEVTGPLLGEELITMADADLTTQHAGQPQGQRIIVSGRVRDSGCRATGKRCSSTCSVCFCARGQAGFVPGRSRF